MRGEEKIEEQSTENNDIISEPSTISEQSLTENMEVHHHPDLHHSKKRFREYFLEFLMIFLAVALGFFFSAMCHT